MKKAKSSAWPSVLKRKMTASSAWRNGNINKWRMHLLRLVAWRMAAMKAAKQA